MSSFMFVVPPFHGHIMAPLAMGAMLIERGHNVCWVGLKDIDSALVPAGGRWIVPEEVETHRQEIEDIIARQNTGTRISGFDALDFGLNETMLPFARMLDRGLQSAIDAFKPDCIIHEESALAGAIGAVANDIPYVTVITSPPGFFEPELFFPDRQKQLLEKMLEFQQAMGLSRDRVIFNSDRLVLSFTSREVLRPHYGDFEFRAPVEFVGAAVEGRPETADFEWERIQSPERPVIYVSIGTVLDDIRSTIFSKIVDAFAGAPVTVIANTEPGLFESWPGNFIVQKRCPQLELLSRVDLVITHGGFNTLNEALYYDKPLIVIPLAWDQFPNADLAVKNNCGIKFKHKRMKPERLRAAAFEVLEVEEYRDNAARLGASLRRPGGTRKAVELVEHIVGNA